MGALRQRIAARSAPSHPDSPLAHSARVRRRIGSIIVFVALLSLAAVMVMPFIWMAATACTPAGELATSRGVNFVPEDWSCIDNFKQLFEVEEDFPTYFKNSALVTLGRLVGQFLLVTLAAYGFARYEFPLKNFLFVLLLAILMVPGQVIVIPQFIVARNLDLVGTLRGVFLPNVGSAFALFLFRQAFLQVPRELIEAAEMDGAGPLRIIYRVMVPLSKPTVAAFTIITAIAAWNEFLWPLVVANSADTRVLTVGISLVDSRSIGTFETTHLVMMASLLSMAPLVIAFVLLQRQFVQGLAATGSKG